MQLMAVRVTLCFLALFVLAGQTFAQQTGTYRAVSVKQATIKKAAATAIADAKQKEQQPIKLLKILQAQQQVVAGMNYKMCLKIKVGKSVKTIETVVYQNLQNQQSVTSWQESSCR